VINSEIRINQASPRHAPNAQNPDSLTKRSDGDKNISAQGNDQSGLLKPLRTPFASDALNSIKSRLNAIAKNIRVADKAIEAIENYIDRMKAELGRIIKNYPPFPPGSEERVRLLKSYISLRKQIDQLTIPPPSNEFNIRIVTDSEFVPEAEDWDVLTDLNSIHIPIPDLSEDTTDEDIVASIAALETAKEMILQRRDKLAGEAEKMSSQEKDALFSKLFSSYGDELADPELKSLEMGYTLSTESGITLSRARSQLLSLLE
jgi:hypothetical protein